MENFPTQTSIIIPGGSNVEICICCYIITNLNFLFILCKILFERNTCKLTQQTKIHFCFARCSRHVNTYKLALSGDYHVSSQRRNPEFINKRLWPRVMDADSNVGGLGILLREKHKRQMVHSEANVYYKLDLNARLCY